MAEVPGEVQAAIVAAYEADVPVRQIMARFGVHEQALYSALRRAGVEPGRIVNGRPRKVWSAEELDCIRRLRLAGASVNKLKLTFGASVPRVKLALQELGLD